MAFEHAERVAVATATTGQGTVTLGAEISDAFQTFAEANISDGATVRYMITEGADFEIGLGTYTASGTTLSRDSVEVSKIGGTAGTTKMTLAGNAVVRLVAINALVSDQEGQVITGGGSPVSKDLTTVSSGTETLNMGARALQRYINGGAHTLAPGTVEGTCVLLITNNGSAGAITVTGFTATDGDGDLTTTNGDDFLVFCAVVNGFSYASFKALQ